MPTITKSMFLISIGFILLNCAGTPATTPVQEVQNAYNKIEEDTLVVKNAPEQLEKAREAVIDVRNSVKKDENKASVEQQIALAKQRIKIAQKTAEFRAAKNNVQRISAELQRLLNEVHKIELEQIEAGRADMPIDDRAKYLKNFKVLQTNRGLVLRFLDVTFETEEAYLTSNAERPINELAEFLGHYPERRIRIEGYTDNTGSESFNRQLSQQRADAVREALISRGIDVARIQTVGLGEQYPIASNETDSGRKQNRRVEIVISDKSGNIPERR